MNRLNVDLLYKCKRKIVLSRSYRIGRGLAGFFLSSIPRFHLQMNFLVSATSRKLDLI